MDPQEIRSRLRSIGRWLVWAAVGIAVLTLLVIVVCGYVYGWTSTGLPKRTLWDWLKLLVVPLVLALGGYWFTRTERAATDAAAERRAQEDALEKYLEQMGELLRDKENPLRNMNSEARILARAWTLTVLARLTGRDRKVRVLEFLNEAGLIDADNPLISFKGADLKGIDLNHARRLEEANLAEADLSKANLEWANLKRANLEWADLEGANLRGADLLGASLKRANLEGANLELAMLAMADLSHIRGAHYQLPEASYLIGATMPDGQILWSDDYPDRPTFEEWLKSKGTGKDGENTSP